MRLSERRHYLYAIHPTDAENVYDYYIGVSNAPDRRWVSHKKDAEKGSYYTVHQNMREMPVSFTVLEEGTEDEIYTREFELRPLKNIGWNMARGGVKASTRKPPRKVQYSLRKLFLSALPHSLREHKFIKLVLSKGLHYKPSCSFRVKNKDYKYVYSQSNTKRMNKFLSFDKTIRGIIKVFLPK